MRTFALVALLALAGCNSSHHDGARADLGAIAQGQRWRDHIEMDRPLPPALFPDVPIVSPELWNWQEHAILWHQHRVAYWENGPSQNSIIISSASTFQVSGNYFTCYGQPATTTWIMQP